MVESAVLSHKNLISSYVPIILLSLVAISGCVGQYVDVGDDMGMVDYDVKTTDDGTKYIIPRSEILSGGPPKGGIGVDTGIAAIADPKFVSVSDADEWVDDNELVLALTYKNVKRVYPLQILVHHEIVNDVVAGDPILITYCPLCGSGIAYERTIGIGGERVETRFGTSGKLYNSNLVMYDEKTDTYWTQIDGLAIMGELTGQNLVPISIDTVAWGDWKSEHPNSEVLSKETGFRRSYGTDPYGGYYVDDFVWFPLSDEDTENKVHPKTVVFGIHINDTYKAYREEDLDIGKIEDTVDGVRVEIEKKSDGTTSFTNLGTSEEIVKERDFWFAWFAFHPSTSLYEVK